MLGPSAAIQAASSLHRCCDRRLEQRVDRHQPENGRAREVRLRPPRDSGGTEAPATALDLGGAAEVLPSQRCNRMPSAAGIDAGAADGSLARQLKWVADSLSAIAGG